MRDMVLNSQWVNRRRYQRTLFFNSVVKQWKLIESVHASLIPIFFFWEV